MDKTNLGLVEFVKSKVGSNYMYSGKGQILTEEILEQVKNTYDTTAFPDNSYYEKTKEFIGTTVRDCSGLIYEYTGTYLNSSSLFSNSKTKGSISTLDDAPIGAGLYFSGHVGVYIGKIDGKHYLIEANGTFTGVVQSEVYSSFTHWFLIPNIEYVELIERDYTYNNKTKTFTIVNLDGNYYVKVRDLVSLLGKSITYDTTTKITTID